MTKHTPGPWHCINDSIGTESFEIATVWNPKESRNLYREKRANARLIAAAPELLEALNELANGYSGNRWDVGIALRLKKARAAIAKATGEPA